MERIDPAAECGEPFFVLDRQCKQVKIDELLE